PLMPAYTVPLIIIGIGATLWRSIRSAAARILLVGLICYPLGDTLNAHISDHLGPHSLRSSAGLCMLILICALGFITAGQLVASASLRVTRAAAATAFACFALESTMPFLTDFFVTRNQRVAI